MLEAGQQLSSTSYPMPPRSTVSSDKSSETVANVTSQPLALPASSSLIYACQRNFERLVCLSMHSIRYTHAPHHHHKRCLLKNTSNVDISSQLITWYTVAATFALSYGIMGFAVQSFSTGFLNSDKRIAHFVHVVMLTRKQPQRQLAILSVISLQGRPKHVILGSATRTPRQIATTCSCRCLFYNRTTGVQTTLCSMKH